MSVFDLIIQKKEAVKLEDVFLNATNKKAISQLIKEHSYLPELQKYGLPVNNKILLHGSSGCGKTTTAKAIANALGKTILILNLSNLSPPRGLELVSTSVMSSNPPLLLLFFLP